MKRLALLLLVAAPLFGQSVRITQKPDSLVHGEQGIRIDDFRIDNVRERVREVGDLWKGVAVGKKRFDLRKVFAPKPKKIRTQNANEE